MRGGRRRRKAEEGRISGLENSLCGVRDSRIDGFAGEERRGDRLSWPSSQPATYSLSMSAIRRMLGEKSEPRSARVET
jgi:hypothetical protein